MKFQPTCSICLCKIKIIDLRIGSRRMGPGRKLLCKHVFHASCLDGIYKPQCPLCEHPIFNTDEETLLTCISEEAAVDILKTLHERDINIKNIFIFLTTHPSAKKHTWIIDLMYKYCDFTELLADNLNDKVLVKEIVKRGKVNWFKTFCGGLTFFDLVYERTDDPDIIALVHSMLPMNSQNVSDIIRPTLTTPNNRNSVTSFVMDPVVDVSQPPQETPATATPPSVPPRTYQKHRRMDSMSGAALEQRLWGPTGPLRTDINRTASVSGFAARRAELGRRSLRASNVLYPSLLTHSEEPLHEQMCSQTSPTYPIYERLYPAIPSAPPIELM